MDQPNIILIVLDTLRKDVLPMYGGNAYTPNLNEFAKDAVVFPNPVVPYPWTVPSNMSFFTGKYAIEHRVHEDGEKIFDHNIDEKVSEYSGKFFWEILKNKGYNTFSFSANSYISPDSGFNKSWDYIKSYYDYDKIQNQLVKKNFGKYGNNIPEIFLNLIKKGELKKLFEGFRVYNEIKKINKIFGDPLMKFSDLIVKDLVNSYIDSPFFIFLNFMEVHEPVTKFDKDITNFQYLDLIGKK